MADSTVADARKEYEALLQGYQWYASWHRDLSDYFQPARSRFLSSEANKPKRNTKNARNRALMSVRVLRAGLSGGLTPRTRPWFGLTTEDPDLAEHGAVKDWLYRQKLRMFERFGRTNGYDALHESYGDDGVFGTSSLNAEEDDLDLMRCYVAPIGSFVIANSDRGEVDTWYHRRTMSVRNLVAKFGIESCSQAVKNLYAAKNWHADIEVIHAVKPRRSRQYGAADSKNMPYQSCWFEKGGTPQDSYLRESGYREFPIMCSRWDRVGEDAYGIPPAADALGAAMGLQKFEERRLRALDMFVNPPMSAPIGVRQDGGVTTLPGQTTYHEGGPQSKVEPSVLVDPRVFIEASKELHDIESQIDSAMAVDLFLLIANEDRSGVTAEEIRAKKEERLLQVGPTIQRMEREKLEPLVNRFFAIMWRRGEIEPPPPELSGVSLGVEFIGPLSSALRLLAVDAINRTSQFVIQMAPVTAGIIDGYDQDVALAEFAKGVGAPPKLVRDQKAIAAIRSDRERQAQMEQMAAMAKPAKDAMVAMQVGAETQPAPGNPLEKMGQAMQGARA